MKYEEIITKLKSGEITIIDSGHRINPILQQLEWQLEHFQERAASEDESEKKYGKKQLEKDYEPGDDLRSDAYCFSCGDNMYVQLLENNKIAMIDHGEYWNISEAKGQKYSYLLQPEDVPVCSMQAKDKLVSEINVETGNLVFANYFKAEKLYETEELGGADINCVKGRNDLMQYLAKQNVGYGQMGNMSVTIFKKDDGTEIIVGDDECYDYDKETDEETFTEFKHQGFTKFGKISLSVWRWQCADEAVLKAYNEMPEGLKETPDSDSYLDEILTIVKPGKWSVEHYYDFSNCKDGIYSRLKLIQK